MSETRIPLEAIQHQQGRMTMSDTPRFTSARTDIQTGEIHYTATIPAAPTSVSSEPTVPRMTERHLRELESLFDMNTDFDEDEEIEVPDTGRLTQEEFDIYDLTRLLATRELLTVSRNKVQWLADNIQRGEVSDAKVVEILRDLLTQGKDEEQR